MGRILSSRGVNFSNKLWTAFASIDLCCFLPYGVEKRCPTFLPIAKGSDRPLENASYFLAIWLFADYADFNTIIILRTSSGFNHQRPSSSPPRSQLLRRRTSPRRSSRRRPSQSSYPSTRRMLPFRNFRRVRILSWSFESVTSLRWWPYGTMVGARAITREPEKPDSFRELLSQRKIRREKIRTLSENFCHKERFVVKSQEKKKARATNLCTVYLNNNVFSYIFCSIWLP